MIIIVQRIKSSGLYYFLIKGVVFVYMKIDLANIDSIDFEGVILYLKFVDEFLSFIKYYNKKLTSILLSFIFYNKYKRKEIVIFVDELTDDIYTWVIKINKRKSLVNFIGKYYSIDLIDICEYFKFISNINLRLLYFKIRIIRNLDNFLDLFNFS